MLREAEQLDACLVDLDNDGAALEPDPPCEGGAGGAGQRHTQGGAWWSQGVLGPDHFSRLSEVLRKVCPGRLLAWSDAQTSFMCCKSICCLPFLAYPLAPAGRGALLACHPAPSPAASALALSECVLLPLCFCGS